MDYRPSQAARSSPVVLVPPPASGVPARSVPCGTRSHRGGTAVRETGGPQTRGLPVNHCHRASSRPNQPQSQTAAAGGGGSPARCLIVDDAARGTPARGATYFSRRVRPLALSSMPMPMIVASMIVPKMLITAVRSSFIVPESRRRPSPMTSRSSAGSACATRAGLDSTLIFTAHADPGSIDSCRPHRRRGLGVRLQLSGTFRT